MQYTGMEGASGDLPLFHRVPDDPSRLRPARPYFAFADQAITVHRSAAPDVAVFGRSSTAPVPAGSQSRLSACFASTPMAAPGLPSICSGRLHPRGGVAGIMVASRILSMMAVIMVKIEVGQVHLTVIQTDDDHHDYRQQRKAPASATAGRYLLAALPHESWMICDYYSASSASRPFPPSLLPLLGRNTLGNILSRCAGRTCFSNQFGLSV